jgi:hypothetical protein
MNKSETSESTSLSELALAGDPEAISVSPTIPILPLLRPVSGLYQYTLQIPIPLPQPIPQIPPISVPRVPTPVPGLTADGEASDAVGGTNPLGLILHREELRLDVDGLYPQRTASGTMYNRLAPVVHWIASLQLTAPNTWLGRIWYKDGSGIATFTYTQVVIKVARAIFPISATITYSGGGGAPFTRTLAYKSPYYHPINLEFDCAQGTQPVLDYQTYSHPNHPPALPNETLTIETVYRRAGFDVSTNTTAASVIPLARAAGGVNPNWSDQEMHDAMQVYWSRFANAPQWAFWTFFASLSESGTSLGGIMFDDIGPNQRQGTAIFVDAFIANPPPADPAPAAWVRRMRFWTACHEMGHTFNLAHSWQKALGTPWIPLANEPLARSFMNYPYLVPGGQAAFFADFMFRFSDQELLFMRHAPERFVEQGNALWFDHHGFQMGAVSQEPTFSLELKPPRQGASFEFLEPVVLDLKLTNISGEPQIVDDKILADTEGMTVIIKKKGKPARQYVPFVRRCYLPKAKALAAGQTMVDSLFVAVGRNGWGIAEPGEYKVQVMLHLDKEDILSAPLALRVERPKSYDEENLASDFFTDDVGRVLAFDGSRTLTKANDTLAEATDMLKGRRVAIHAHVALGSSLAKPSKLLEIRDTEAGVMNSAAASGGKIQQTPAEEKEAREHLEVLTKQPNVADQTLGRTDYAYYLEQHGDLLGTKTAHQRLLEVAAEASAEEVPTPILARTRSTVGRTGRSLAKAEK